MESEIVKRLELTREQSAMLDMHSILNILNLLMLELSLLNLETGDARLFDSAMSRVSTISESFQSASSRAEVLRAVLQHGVQIRGSLAAFEQDFPEICAQPENRESVGNIENILAVLEVRLDELVKRLESRDSWVEHSVPTLLDAYTNFLAAVELNSKGHYRIVYNIAAQEQRDYLVNLRIQSTQGDRIFIPPVFTDIFRDLIANARKYTQPGGRINAGMVFDERELRIVVEDTGCGIPEDQIERVVEFGYRATNVRERPTMGGGFGLTKAYLETQRLGGRMWISSALNQGTRVTIRLPFVRGLAQA